MREQKEKYPMKALVTLVCSVLFLTPTLFAQTLTVEDNFEGDGTITTWTGDDCDLNTAFDNPVPDAANSSATVLEYHDVGGDFANIRFDVPVDFLLIEKSTFTFKIYVPSGDLTGSQNNQVSLKLQDGTLGAPWSTQSEIVKPIALDQWQTVSFDFANDNYTNLDPTSLPPTQRTDFNRVLIQVNGEGNSDQVRAYIDDFSYDGTLSVPVEPVYDQLVWADEFDTDGPIDDTKWFHQTQLPIGDSWFNGEIQHYTDRIENSYVEDGILKVVARKETFTDQGVTKEHTSARLNSKFVFQYGRVEVRAKLPFGPGTWPAIWMLGQNINEDGGYWDLEGYGTTPWPACGEIDIMEHWGTNQNYVQSATHTPSSFGATINHGGQIIPTVSDEFHVYTLVWSPDKLVFGVDGVEHFTYNPPIKDAETWPFDAPQYFLLNVAILPEIAANFTSSAMELDYIRVYQEGPSSTNRVVRAPAQAFPMPFKDAFEVRLPEGGEGETTVYLYDLQGRLQRMETTFVQNGGLSLQNLGELPEGMYLLFFNLGGQSYQLKVTK
ncbi:MAG: family 16 glycosylhydrolase [Bacteroidota bacterium]